MLKEYVIAVFYVRYLRLCAIPVNSRFLRPFRDELILISKYRDCSKTN